MSWPQVKLEALAADIPYAFVGGPFGSRLTTRDYVGNGIPVIRGSNMKGGRYLDMTDFVFVSKTKMQEDLAGNLARENDLIFTQRGTLGQVVMIPEAGLSPVYVVSQSQMKLTVDGSKADRRFIYYYCSSPAAVGRIINLASSSGVPHINLTVLRNFEIPVPPLETQKRMVSILSAYDDLIENNRRRIELLERAAREIYREWFVRLRFPGHERTKIADGVPEGWDRRPFEECLVAHIGGGWGKDEPIGDETTSAYVIRGTDLAPVRRGEFSKVGLRFHKDSSLRNRLLRPGDIVFEVSGGSATQPVGRSILIGEELIDVFGNRVICASFCKKLEPESRVFGVYLHQYLEFIRQSGEMQVFQKQSASALQNFNFAAFLKSHLVSQPSESILRAFADIASSLLKQQAQLAIQNHRLARARDLLLPRLMSGEVAV